MKPVEREQQDVAEIESDVLLMQQIAQQNHLALRLLIDKYRHLLQSVIGKVCYDRSTVDDVFQEATFTVWRVAHTYDPSKGSPIGWLVTVYRRRAVDTVRRAMSYEGAKERLAVAHQTPDIDDWRPSDDCLREESSQFIAQQLARLPAHQKLALWCHYFKGMSQREIAEYTGASLGTVKTRLELGLVKLRRAFSSLGDLRQS